MAYNLNMINEIMLREWEGKDPNEIAQSSSNQITWPLRLKELAEMARLMSNSLLGIINTSYIQDYLRENDPMGLQQVFDALGIFEQVAR